MEEEDPKEDPSKEEDEAREEEGPKEDSSDAEEEQLEEEDPKEDSIEERAGLTEEENLVRRPESLEDEAMDFEEKRGEFGESAR